jgi:hypothetical protein
VPTCSSGLFAKEPDLAAKSSTTFISVKFPIHHFDLLYLMIRKPAGGSRNSLSKTDKGYSLVMAFRHCEGQLSVYGTATLKLPLFSTQLTL